MAACAGYGPGDLKPGRAEADVIARMGTPTDRADRADGGKRLDFARGPMGKHTYRVEVDASGRVQGVRQLLTEANFEAVRPGESRAAVIERIGRASDQRTGWRGVGEVWSYRYESVFCRWFQVWFVDGAVREASFAEDPMCAEPRRRDD
ncbi:MAG TPA: hypothetical protein VFQ20_08695 [Burkholderiaceae bacterium]|nr:hypothetical protein [Burkholderiaceae bacterium]